MSHRKTLVAGVIALVALGAITTTMLRDAKRAAAAAQTANTIRSFEQRVAAVMRDPSSTQFRFSRLASNGTALCGEVNAKNGFGGYVGFKMFVVDKTGVVIAPDSGFEELSRYIEASDRHGCANFYAQRKGVQG